MRVSAALWTHIKNETTVARVRVACWLVPSWHDKFAQLEELRAVNRRLLASRSLLDDQLSFCRDQLFQSQETVLTLRDVIAERNHQMRGLQDELAEGTETV